MKKKKYHKFPEALQQQLPLYYYYFEAIGETDTSLQSRVRFHGSAPLQTNRSAVRNFYKHISRML
jgi:hypothetical protein